LGINVQPNAESRLYNIQIAKILKGTRIGVVLIASQPAGSIEENNNLWRTFIKCRQQLAGKVDLEFCL